ncbi:MAG: SGNH/GDSL hydrolase family protein [Dysgonamonadaceae bacterium]|jgi:lysophospholipase L1-like esterase|nr:SGNH/GDSL hydrolase family protein [Dysgonamonadaceae bacterium]
MKNRIVILLFVSIVMLSGFDVYAQDWANLKRFEKDNAQAGMPKTNESRVVFMGNSITQGWIEKAPDFFEGKPYFNRGISGQTTPQMLLRFRQDVIKLYPKVVVILAGTNDIAGNTGPSTLEMIEDNLYSMAELAQAHGIQVVFCSVLPVFDYPWRPGLEPAPKIEELNKRIKNYADTHGAVYCDFFTAMADERKGLKAELSKDGVHPNEKGYDIMAPLVEKAIARALLMWKGFK